MYIYNADGTKHAHLSSLVFSVRTFTGLVQTSIFNAHFWRARAIPNSTQWRIQDDEKGGSGAEGPRKF